jgi:hypothetical protein
VIASSSSNTNNRFKYYPAQTDMFNLLNFLIPSAISALLRAERLCGAMIKPPEWLMQLRNKARSADERGSLFGDPAVLAQLIAAVTEANSADSIASSAPDNLEDDICCYAAAQVLAVAACATLHLAWLTLRDACTNCAENQLILAETALPGAALAMVVQQGRYACSAST